MASEILIYLTLFALGAVFGFNAGFKAGLDESSRPDGPFDQDGE